MWPWVSEKPANLGAGTVLLTNMSVKKPLRVQALYLTRSAIENTPFREGKQAWAHENIPQKNYQAVVAHVPEFSNLSGNRIKKLPERLVDRKAIFARYGLDPPLP